VSLVSEDFKNNGSEMLTMVKLQRAHFTNPPLRFQTDGDFYSREVWGGGDQDQDQDQEQDQRYSALCTVIIFDIYYIVFAYLV